jgi:peptidoglycan/xylan/chitin deacetylase (PgdA/CDA1 family)
MQAATLLYHDVVPHGHLESSGFSGPVANRYKLTIDQFESHLLAMAVSPDVEQATAREVLNRSAGGHCPCLFSFDDGGVSCLTEIADRLEAFDWRGHFFITTDCLDQPGFLLSEQLVELHQRGHIIGTHSCSHPPRIDELSDAELFAEWSQSAEHLADLLHEPIWCGSVPGGFFSERVASAAERAGLKLLFNSEPDIRWRSFGSMTIAGRLPIVNHTTAESAVKLASADALTLWRHQFVWKSKKLAKTITGRWYRQAAEWWFRASREPQPVRGTR